MKLSFACGCMRLSLSLSLCVCVCVCGDENSIQKASFGRPITKDEFKTILFPASMHGLGHIAANISFAAVAISLTHTVKTLEPVFNVAMSKLVLGTSTSVPVALSLLPITLGVAAASASELSFNWTGFISAMLSNLTFSFRAVYSKKVCFEHPSRQLRLHLCVCVYICVCRCRSFRR